MRLVKKVDTNMGVMQKLLNLDDYFKTTDGDKIIVNNLSLFSNEDLEFINNKLMTTHDNTDVISIKPRCDCGKLEGNFKLGKICKHCSTICEDPYKKVKPVVWLQAIEDKYRFLNPILWIMLDNLLSGKGFTSPLRYLSDTRYNPPVKIPIYMDYIKDVILDGERRYDKLMENLIPILQYCISMPRFSKAQKSTAKLLIGIIEANGDKIFSKYLPILNKRLFVSERSRKVKFINLINAESLDIVMSFIKLAGEAEHISDRRKSNVMGNLMATLASLYNKYFYQYLDTKHGILRKNVYGARSHFTFRCVIVSITGRHQHDEIEAPWCVGITAFRPHLINKLYKLGYSYKEASRILYLGVKKYNPLLDKLLNELIAESKYKGIPVLAQRNKPNLSTINVTS